MILVVGVLEHAALNEVMDNRTDFFLERRAAFLHFSPTILRPIATANDNI